MTDITHGAIAPAFVFETRPLRHVMRGDSPWFVVADVLHALSLGRSSLRRLDPDEKGGHPMPTPGGIQPVTIISESGLYSLILRSDKPEAKRFKKWITAEVLPAIRRTGRYEAAAPTGHSPALRGLQDQAALLAEQQRRVARLSQRLLAQNPDWAALARYRALGLSLVEIGKLLGVCHNTVTKRIAAIQASGVQLPARASALQAASAAPGQIDLRGVQHG